MVLWPYDPMVYFFYGSQRNSKVTTSYPLPSQPYRKPIFLSKSQKIRATFTRMRFSSGKKIILGCIFLGKDSLLRLVVSLPRSSGEQKSQLRFPICFQPHRSEVRECCIKTILTISELLIFGTLCCQFWACPAANLQGSELETPELRPAERRHLPRCLLRGICGQSSLPFLSDCCWQLARLQ